MRRTIWSPGVFVKPEDVRVKVLFTRVLPTIDVLLMAFGVFAILFGMPVLNELFGQITLGFGGAIFAAAATALYGLAFLNEKVEVVAKIILLSILILYPFFLLGTFTPGRAAAGVLCCIPIPILFWRIGDLGREKGKGG